LRELEIADDLSDEVEKIDAEIFKVKRKISHIEMTLEAQNLKENSQKEYLKTSKSNMDGQIKDLTNLENSSKQSQEVLQAKSNSGHIKRSVSSRSSRSTRSSIKQKATIAGLEAKCEALRKTQEAEAELYAIKAEVEAETAKQLKEAQQKIELLKLEEEISKAKAIKDVYIKEENAAIQKGSDKSCKSKSSNSSHISRVSNKSSIAQEAHIAGLEAEGRAKRKTQQAELDTCVRKHSTRFPKYEHAGTNVILSKY